MKKKIIKNIIILSCSLMIVMTPVSAYAWSSEETEVNKENNIIHNNNPSDNTGNANVGNSNTTQYPSGNKYKKELGSFWNPIPVYLTTADYSDFTRKNQLYGGYSNWGRNIDSVNAGEWGLKYGGDIINVGPDGKYYRNYAPTYVITKTENWRNEKIDYVIDYYKWSLESGPCRPSNWSSSTVKTPTKENTVKFPKVGSYTISSTPHSVTTFQRWKEYKASFYIKYSNGHITWIDGYSSSTAKETYTTQKLNTENQKFYSFNISPEEVDLPIDPSTVGEDLPRPEVEGFLIE